MTQRTYFSIVLYEPYVPLVPRVLFNTIEVRTTHRPHLGAAPVELESHGGLHNASFGVFHCMEFWYTFEVAVSGTRDGADCIMHVFGCGRL